MALPTDLHNPGAPSRQVDPCSFAAEITANDNTDLTIVPRFILISKGTDTVANLAVIMDGMLTAVVLPLATGIMHRLRVRRIMSTDTTATKIVALW